MTNSINQRANKNEIISRGIVHKEYLDNDYTIAKNNIKQNRQPLILVIGHMILVRRDDKYVITDPCINGICSKGGKGINSFCCSRWKKPLFIGFKIITQKKSIDI